jgi:hypothetical protein
MKRDRNTLSLLLGLAVLILGIVLVFFTFYSFISIATNPNSFLRQQGQAVPLQASAGGPTAAFSWQTNGFTLSAQDHSQPNGATIVNWTWDAGDGRGVGYGQTIQPYTYAQTGTYTISLTIHDANQNTGRVQTQIQIPSNASGNAGPVGGGGGNTGGNNSGNNGGNNSGGCTGSNCGGLFGGGTLIQVAAVILTLTMHVVMGYTGVHFIRAGYGLLRPRGAAILVPMHP